MVSSADEARDALSETAFSHIFVHRDIAAADASLIQTYGESNPYAGIHLFSTESDIVINNTSDIFVDTLLERTLRMNEFSARSGSAFGQTEQVAELTAALCDRFEISSHIRRAALAAVRLSRVAERDLTDPSAYTASDVIALSASRLADLGYPSLVVTLVRRMAGAHPIQSKQEIPAATLVGDILAAAQRYWSLRGQSATDLPAERRRAIARTLHDEFNEIGHKDMIRALLSIADARDAFSDEHSESFVVYIYHPESADPLHWRAGFERADIEGRFYATLKDLASAWKNRTPHGLVVCVDGDSESVRDALFQMALSGVVVTEAPTLLMLSEHGALSSLWSVKQGVEDILCGDGAVEALITKLCRIRERREEIARVRLAAFQDMGTHGTLEDMSVMNLLEALRGNSKAVRLSVSARGRQLTAYVNQDRVLFAECDDATGMAAFTQCVNWSQGIWSIDPVDPDEIPSANLDQTIDSVMLEACVTFDETSR